MLLVTWMFSPKCWVQYIWRDKSWKNVLLTIDNIPFDLISSPWCKEVWASWLFTKTIQDCGVFKNTMRKRGVIGFATQVLSCIGHMQLTIFIHCECYRISYKSCKNCNLPYIQCNSLQLNSITTLLQQFFFNYYATPLWLQS
jgi:hypothetical protein